jgi:hypothetical protein
MPNGRLCLLISLDISLLTFSGMVKGDFLWEAAALQKSFPGRAWERGFKFLPNTYQDL